MQYLFRPRLKTKTTVPRLPFRPPDNYLRDAMDLAGQRLVIALRNGISVEGRYLGITRGLLKMESAIIKSREGAYAAPWIYIDRQQVSHLHPPPVEIAPGDQ